MNVLEKYGLEIRRGMLIFKGNDDLYGFQVAIKQICNIVRKDEEIEITLTIDSFTLPNEDDIWEFLNDCVDLE